MSSENQTRACISVRIHDADQPESIPLTLPQASVHCFSPGSFHFNLEEGKHAYVTTSDSLDFSRPPRENHFHLRPERGYVVSGDAFISGSRPQIWIIEYSDKARLSHKNIKLPTGRFNLEWTSHPEHQLLVIALRFHGSGTLSLTDVNVIEQGIWSSRPLSFDFSAPVSPETAAGEPYPLLPPLRFDDVK